MVQDPGPAVAPLSGLLMPMLIESSVMPGLAESSAPGPPALLSRVHPATSSAAMLTVATTPLARAAFRVFVIESPLSGFTSAGRWWLPAVRTRAAPPRRRSWGGPAAAVAGRGRTAAGRACAAGR